MNKIYCNCPTKKEFPFKGDGALKYQSNPYYRHLFIYYTI